MSDMTDNLSQPKLTVTTTQWTQKDTGWMFNLFGTAIGAGVLYLPISTGVGGIWPLIILSLFAGPMVWLAHRNLVRFCLSSKSPTANITTTVQEHFGKKAGHWLTLAYCLSIYPILLMYSIGMTNITIDYINRQLKGSAWPREWVSLTLVSLLIVLMHAEEKWMLRAVQAMVYPLVLSLFAISVYLIPQWNMTIFEQSLSWQDALCTFFFSTPLLIFSFNHSPACSSFAQAYRMVTNSVSDCEKKTQQILTRNTLLLLAIILFFVFSCIFTLTPTELAQAKLDNLPVLSVLHDRSNHGILLLLAPVIAFLAVVSSFFGVYLGALEGIQGIATQQWLKYRPNNPINPITIRRAAALFILLTCWGAGYANWTVISMIEAVVVPLLASILYIMPVYANYRIPRLHHYRNTFLDVFIFVVGIIAITSFLLAKMVH